MTLLSRRNLLKTGFGVAALSTTAWLRPSDIGGAHSDYFRALSRALDKQSFARPTLIIDKQILRQNIHTLSKHIQDKYDYRIVAKSLPSVPLLKLVSELSASKRFMLFNEKFVTQLSAEIPDADILLGKPLPINAAKYVYGNTNKPFQLDKQLQWLIDAPKRLSQYQVLARQINQRMRINIELDVGLHRGGVQDDQTLLEMLNIIQQEPLFTLSGFMGYEPHIVKLPGNASSHLDSALDIYRQRIKTTENFLGHPLPEDITLNTAGSPSYPLHLDSKVTEHSPCTELSAGSCLVKPIDFDIPSLSDHHAASFIATPVLKHLKQTEIPGVDGLGSLMSLWNPNRQQSFFTYGGYWKAKPVSPPGLSINPVYGRSTNQEMLNGSSSVNLNTDDWVFLRPTQSEFVFLQFGDIAIYENGEITELWPILS